MPAAQQQDEAPLHRDHRHRRGGDVGRLGIVDPEDTAHVSHGLEPVRQRPEGAEPSPNQRRWYPRCVDGERRRECIRDVVVTEQMQLVTRDQRLATDPEHASFRVVPRIGRCGE